MTDQPKPIPDYYNRVMPYLMVQNVARLIEFVQTVFDAELRLKVDRTDGSIMHAEVAIGES